MSYLLLWCSGAGEVLADNISLLRSMEKISIRDINPIPVLQVLAQNAKHSVSRMAVSVKDHPELVRCVSMGPAARHTPSAPQVTLVQCVCMQSCCITCHTVEGVRNTNVLCGSGSRELYSCDCKLCISPQMVGVSDLLGQCKSIRAFELYLDKGRESLSALNSCLEGVCLSSSIESLLISCRDAGQWCPALGLLWHGAVGMSPVALSVSNVFHE